jgi:hypothetical protein
MKNLIESVRAMYAPRTEATMMKDDGKIVHNCAKHVEHAEYGRGDCISEEHAAPDRNGNIAWYDVMFEHGLERGVPTAELSILQAESHMHANKKSKKVMENDGNLANNAKPYDKVTHGDVITGRLGKDEYGGKKKKPAVKEEAGGVPEKPTGGSNAATPEDHNRPIKKKAMDAAMAAANKTATGPLAAQGMTKEAVEFSMTAEQWDQLDELSKQTLGSYVKKAKEHAVGLGVGLGVAAMKRRDRSDVADKLKQRTMNIDKAVDRITKEDVDLDEAAMGQNKMANLKAAHDRHSEKAIAANKSGDHEAVKVHQSKMNMLKNQMNNLRKEEVEGLGEKEGYGSVDPLAARADYAKRHGTGQVYKKTYPGDKTGMSKAFAYDIKRSGPKGKLPEEVDFPIQEDHDQEAPALVDETIITAVKEYDISEAQKSSGYDAHFKAMMTKHGVKHPGELDTPEKKKAFFNKVDASYNAKNEDVFLEAMMASDLMKIKDAHTKAGNKISDEKTGSKGGDAHHSFVVTTPEGKRTRHIYHGSTKKVETMSAAPRSKQAKETGEDDDDK